ncbi:helix-turn-helix domain-containing protein [Nocardioides carbamazepini]|uniref:helix-turn-helix domain-containing protein n=1 Tax=Nocardioides carbamazepini TaxID=2854259 RepID=UPI00214A1697|nr:helix-turn-helix transcriptional regulator [Nocardioides carbamazepini]MCR1781779.1 helix-turn-helix domain-containing protein [Nocardioides carbamazepini]
MPWSADAGRLLGQRVRQLRDEKALTQEALAQLAGCTKNHVQVIEAAGRAAPGRVDMGRQINLRMDTLFGIAEALDVHPWDLIKEAATGA